MDSKVAAAAESLSHVSGRGRKRRLKASSLAAYFHLDCDKYLKLQFEPPTATATASASATAANASPKESVSTSPVSVSGSRQSAVLERGMAFERVLLSSIGADRITDCTADADSMERLRTAKPDSILYQSKFSLPPAFYPPALTQIGIEFTYFRPDFLLIQMAEDDTSGEASTPAPVAGAAGTQRRRSRRVVIVDAKSSAHMKLSHQIQVSIYAVFLRWLIAAAGIEDLEVSSRAEIWIPAETAIPPFSRERFALDGLTGLVSDFMFIRLPELLRQSIDRTEWHLTPTCGSCEYFNACKTETVQRRTLSHIPYLSKRDARWLTRALRSEATTDSVGSSSSSAGSTGSTGSVDIEDLADFLTAATAATAAASAHRNPPPAGTAVAATAGSTVQSSNRYTKLAQNGMSTHCRHCTVASANPLPDVAHDTTALVRRRVESILKVRTFESGGESPFVSSIRSGSVQVIESVSVSFPSSEESAVLISCVDDPFTKSAITWGIHVFSRKNNKLLFSKCESVPYTDAGAGSGTRGDAKSAPAAASGFELLRSNFVHTLSDQLRSLESQRPTFTSRERVCVFFIDFDERASVYQLLASAVDATTRTSASAPASSSGDGLGARAMSCLLTLVQDASLLHPSPRSTAPASTATASATAAAAASSGTAAAASSSFPNLIDYSTEAKDMTFAKLGRLKRAELEAMCDRKGLDKTGKKKEVLAERIRRADLRFLLATKSGAAKFDAGSESLARLEEAAEAALKAEKKESNERKAELYKPRSACVIPAVRHHLCLPVPGFYRFADTVRWLAPTAAAAQPTATSAVDCCDADAIYAQWKSAPQSSGGSSTAVNDAMHNRLIALLAVIDGLRSTIAAAQAKRHSAPAAVAAASAGAEEKSAPAKSKALPSTGDGDPTSFYLLEKAAKFRLLPALPFAHPLLSRLAFIAVLESLAECNKMSAPRLSGHALAATEKIVLRYDGPTTTTGESKGDLSVLFTAVPTGSGTGPAAALSPDPAKMKNWLLAENTTKGRIAAMRFVDMLMVDQLFGFIPSLALADVISSNQVITPVTTPPPTAGAAAGSGASAVTPIAQSTTSVTLKLSIGGLKQLRTGAEYVLYRRYVNFTSKKILTSLQQTDLQFLAHAQNPKLPKPIFVDLLENPNEWGCTAAQNAAALIAHCDVADTKSSAAPLVVGLSFTASQTRIFRRCLSNRLQIIWGPPGSGKTHFLALAILRLCAYHRSVAPKTTFRVLVTAFTHSAIDNLLARIVLLQKKLSDSTLPIAKLVNDATDVPATAIQSIEGKHASGFVDSNPVCVIGATIWSAAKSLFASGGGSGGDADGFASPFSLVVVDEASQVPVSHGAVVAPFVDRNNTRLWVAGDHLQLSPITHLQLTALTDSTAAASGGSPVPLLHGSLLECMIRAPNGRPCTLDETTSMNAVSASPATLKLGDNFRMNSELGAFAQNLYGADYTVVQPNQSIPISESGVKQYLSTEPLSTVKPSPNSAVISSLLDGSCGALSVLRLAIASSATDRVRRLLPESYVTIEARAVARITAAAIAGNAAATTAAASDSGDTKSAPATASPSHAAASPFSIFIVTPHHTQRKAVTRALSARSIQCKSSADVSGSGSVSGSAPPQQSRPYSVIVDTVEKLQGREAELVIVCYGFLDAESIAGEMEFLFNRNRLNVAITRARCKAILVASNAVLQPAVSYLSSPACKAAFAYLRSVQQHSSRTAEYAIDNAELDQVMIESGEIRFENALSKLNI